MRYETWYEQGFTPQWYYYTPIFVVIPDKINDLINMLEDMETDPITNSGYEKLKVSKTVINPYAMNRKLGLIAQILREIYNE